MTEDNRSIELEIEVAGTPEEVWAAIATGPGISSWFVPHEVDEREGGEAVAQFGPGPEMAIPHRVTAWEPHRRFVLDSAVDGGEGLAFEWLVEASGEGTCVVRLVNTGFGSGEDWDGQYDGMVDGWPMFLHNLALHRTHFGGQAATASLGMGMWLGSREDAFASLLALTGLPESPRPGDAVTVRAEGAPSLSGVVTEVADWRMALVLDAPARGTAFLAAEGTGGMSGVSVWCYLYGPDAEALAAETESAWTAWLAEHGSGG